MFKKNELKILFPFYAHSLIFNLSKVIMPFYVLYFLGIGLSFFQIALLGSIRSIISLIFEAPTGTIADLYGRRASVILGYLLTAVTIFLISFQNSFYLIAVILAFDALFETFISGADRAWAVDLLEEQDKTLIDSYFLKTRFFKNLGYVIAPLIAGFIVSKTDMRYLWSFFSLGIILSTIFLFWGKKANKQKTIHDNVANEEGGQYFFKHLNNSLSFVRKHKIVSLLFLVIFIFYFVDEITSLVWTPYLKNVGVSLPTVGYLFSIIAAIGIILPIIIEKILNYKSKFSIITSTLFVYAGLLLLVGFIDKILLLIVIFILLSSAEEIFLPLEESLTNSYIKNQNRATVLSIKSMVESLASIIGGPFAGFILGVISSRQAIFLSGLLFLFLPIIYLIIKNREQAVVAAHSPEPV